MDGTVFFYVGIALVVAALALAYVGIKGKTSWPSSRRTFLAVIVPFAVLVVATAAYAVANAREEQEHRGEELAEEAEAAEPAEPPPGGPAEPLDVASPEDGSLVFEPDGLQASAGPILLAYSNPSPIPHNINLEDSEGQTLAESEDVTDGEVELAAELTPGEFVFYCSIPGHRESGMEGTLTVE